MDHRGEPAAHTPGDVETIDAAVRWAKARFAWDDSIHLGPAAPHDGSCLISLERAAFPWLPDPEGHVLAAFDCDRPFVSAVGPLMRIVARINGPIVGYVFVQPRSDELFVWDMAHRTTTVGATRLGFGSLLMLVAVGVAKVTARERMTFNVTRRDGRQQAHLRLCTKHGLSVIPDRGVMLDGSPSSPDAIWMAGAADEIVLRILNMTGAAYEQGRRPDRKRAQDPHAAELQRGEDRDRREPVHHRL